MPVWQSSTTLADTGFDAKKKIGIGLLGSDLLHDAGFVQAVLADVKTHPRLLVPLEALAVEVDSRGEPVALSGTLRLETERERFLFIPVIAEFEDPLGSVVADKTAGSCKNAHVVMPVAITPAETRVPAIAFPAGTLQRLSRSRYCTRCRYM